MYTTEGKAALIHKTSVNCNTISSTFQSPFFVFTEKVILILIIIFSMNRNFNCYYLLVNIYLSNHTKEHIICIQFDVHVYPTYNIGNLCFAL